MILIARDAPVVTLPRISSIVALELPSSEELSRFMDQDYPDTQRALKMVARAEELIERVTMALALKEGSLTILDIEP